MPPRRPRGAATLEVRLREGLLYFSGLREDAELNSARLEDLDDALKSPDLALIGSTTILSGIVAAHAWAARALAADVLHASGAWVLEVTLKNLYRLTSQQGSPAADRLVRALLRADTLAVYSRVCSRMLLPTRGAAAAHRGATPGKTKLGLLVLVLQTLFEVASCVRTSPDAGLRQELVTALTHTQLLEHAARALLHAAQTTPAASAGAGAGTATDPIAEMWKHVAAAAAFMSETLPCLMNGLGYTEVYPRPRNHDALAGRTHNPDQFDLLKQLRPLLAGPCVQLFVAWAGLCAAMTVRQGASDGSTGQSLAPAGSQLWHGLPPTLVLPMQLRQAAFSVMATVTPQVLAVVLQAIVSGPCDLAVAQPPVGYDRPAPDSPHRQPVQQQQAVAAAAGSSSSAAATQAAQADAAAPFSALHAYALLREVWCGLACDSKSHMFDMCAIALVMARLLTELRPRRAAELLPGWWRLVAQEPSMLVQQHELSRDAGMLLRLQLSARPPAAWAAEVTDAASVVAASVDWPPETAQVQEAEAGTAGSGVSAAVAAKAAASLACGRDPSYSLRYALDAGMLPAVERCLRAPQAWQQAGDEPSSAGHLLYVVNCVLRCSGVWPAVLARGPVRQAVSLIATLGAAARRLQGNDTAVDHVLVAAKPGMCAAAECGAGGYLCAYLAALLEQVADVRALREQAQEQREGQQHAEGQQQQGQLSATDAAALAPAPLCLNLVLEWVVAQDSSATPSQCSIAWMAATGGMPAAGSAADWQQQLLTSFAVHLWLPSLARATEAAVADLATARTERKLMQALLVGRLLMDVLWREERPTTVDDGGTGSGAGAAAGKEAHSPRPEAAWWEGAEQTDLLANSMHVIVDVLTKEAVGLLLEQCAAWQQAAALDLLQSYWARFPGRAYDATKAWAERMAKEQQYQQQKKKEGEEEEQQQRDGQLQDAAGSSGNAAQQPPPPELMLQHLEPLPVQRLALLHGRQDIADYLDSAAVKAREEVAKRVGNAASAADSSTEARGPAGCEDGGSVLASATEARLMSEWRGAVRPRYPWLLSPGEVRAGLHDLMASQAVAAAAAAAAGTVGGIGSSRAGRSSTGAGQDGTSDGPAFGHRLCGNPHCCSLDGPSALVAPGSGKTCVRCRAVTYCCGACQLADWRGRHSGTCSGAAAAAAGAGAASEKAAALKKA